MTIEVTSAVSSPLVGPLVDSITMNSSRWLTWSARLLVVLSIAGAVYYRARLSPIPVYQHVVSRGEIRTEVMGTGTLEARFKASIGPKIAGRVREIKVDQGDEVAQGAVLVTLDDDEFQQQVAIAQANLEVTQAAIDRLKSDEVRAHAVVTQAKSEHQRNLKLAAENAASQSAVDKSVESLAVAEAGIARANFAVIEGQKQLVAAEKTLQFQQARLADTQIVAPFDGLIVRRQRDAGDVAVPGSPMLTLISRKELWISAWVDETEMAHLAIDQPARVVFRSEPNRNFSGHVARLGQEADRETREFVVDVRVLDLPQNWAVGQRADVYIETARKSDALWIPSAYVALLDKQPGTWINRHEAAEWHPLEFGLKQFDKIEVVQGLEPGETIVIPVSNDTPLQAGRRIKTP